MISIFIFKNTRKNHWKKKPHCNIFLGSVLVESIVAASVWAGCARWERASVPPREQSVWEAGECNRVLILFCVNIYLTGMKRKKEERKQEWKQISIIRYELIVHSDKNKIPQSQERNEENTCKHSHTHRKRHKHEKMRTQNNFRNKNKISKIRFKTKELLLQCCAVCGTRDPFLRRFHLHVCENRKIIAKTKVCREC